MIEIQPVLIFYLHDTCDVLNAYDLHDIVLGDGAKFVSFEINACYLNCVIMKKSLPLCGLLFMKKLKIMSSRCMNNIC